MPGNNWLPVPLTHSENKNMYMTPRLYFFATGLSNTAFYYERNGVIYCVDPDRDIFSESCMFKVHGSDKHDPTKFQEDIKNKRLLEVLSSSDIRKTKDYLRKKWLDYQKSLHENLREDVICID